MSDAPVVHIDDLTMDDLSHGDRFEAALGRIGPRIGMRQLGCMLTVVPPGKRAFPFHNHHVIEEAMVILAGDGTYRLGSETYPVRAGSVIAAPAGGRDTAHQLINTGDKELKYICFSTAQKTDVVEYPDSNKVSAVTWDAKSGAATFRHRAYAQVIDYYEGEE